MAADDDLVLRLVRRNCLTARVAGCPLTADNPNREPTAEPTRSVTTAITRRTKHWVTLDETLGDLIGRLRAGAILDFPEGVLRKLPMEQAQACVYHEDARRAAAVFRSSAYNCPPCSTPAPASSAPLSASRSCRRPSPSCGCSIAGSTTGAAWVAFVSD